MSSKFSKGIPVRVQDFRLVTNVQIDDVPDIISDQGAIRFQHPVLIEAAEQSNSWDCGPHCINNLRSMAAHALNEQSSWSELALPQGIDDSRDDQWRREIAEDCIALRLALPGSSEDNAGDPVLVD